MKTQRLVYTLLAIGIFALAGYFIFQAMRDSLVYFILPNEYAQASSQYEGRRLRLGGLVEEGSVVFDDQKLELRFTITDSIQSYPVVHLGSPPSLFEENTGVVVEGHFRADDTFESDNLLIKHSEVYEPPKDGEINVEKLKESLE